MPCGCGCGYLLVCYAVVRLFFFFFSSRRRHTRWPRDWSSDVCSSDLARSASDFSFDEMGKVQLSRWWNGRIALIGDAAACPTPLSGLGTSVALVGAYVLAGELGDGSDHAAAFAAYDRLVRPYVEGAQQLAGGPGGYAPMTALAIRFMQASMSWATRWPMRGFMEKQFSKASDIDLPDYTPA